MSLDTEPVPDVSLFDVPDMPEVPELVPVEWRVVLPDVPLDVPFDVPLEVPLDVPLDVPFVSALPA